jgi:hypothetical protein
MKYGELCSFMVKRLSPLKRVTGFSLGDYLVFSHSYSLPVILICLSGMKSLTE